MDAGKKVSFEELLQAHVGLGNERAVSVFHESNFGTGERRLGAATQTEESCLQRILLWTFRNPIRNSPQRWTTSGRTRSARRMKAVEAGTAKARSLEEVYQPLWMAFASLGEAWKSLARKLKPTELNDAVAPNEEIERGSGLRLKEEARARRCLGHTPTSRRCPRLRPGGLSARESRSVSLSDAYHLWSETIWGC